MKKTVLFFFAILVSSAWLMAQTKQPSQSFEEKPGFYILSSESLKDIESQSKPDVTKIYGKIKIVDSFPDYKVKIVSSFADLHVKLVSSFPDDVGKWKIVESFPDFKIQFVDSFPDFTIKYVENFPGKP